MAVSFREVTALVISVTPTKTTRKHTRAVVTGKGKSKLKLLNEDGNPIEVDTDEEGDPEEGEDTVLLLRGQGGQERGTPATPGGQCAA